jgi:hypothetical protein
LLFDCDVWQGGFCKLRALAPDRNGATSQDFFGTAYGQTNGRYAGFQFGSGTIQIDDTLLLIEPGAAKLYHEAQAAAASRTSMATSVGGVLTGRGADFIIIDAPLKPEEALSETQRKSVNQWFDNSLLSRLNHKE